MDGAFSIEQIAKLIPLVIRRERKACEDFVVAVRDRVFGTALAVLRDEHRALDAAQEVCVKALRAIDNLREPEQWQPWLVQMTRRHCIDMLRGQAARREVPLGEFEPPAGDAPMDAGSRAAVRSAVYDLPEDMREVVIAFYLEQASIADIAARCGKTENHVGVLLHRARKQLYEKLRPHP